MTRRKAKANDHRRLRQTPDNGTRIAPSKNQGYTLPLPLWQDLVEEATRRKKLGLPMASQNAIAVAGIAEWLERHKGAAE